MSQLMERLGDPEQVIADLNRRRHMKVFAAIAILTLGVAVVVGGTALAFLDEPAAASPPAAVAP